MKLIQTAIPDVVIIEPSIFHDDRGWFMESFNEDCFHRNLQNLGLPTPPPFVQDNHSYSKKGVMRGLHYQLPPHAQGKLVRVVKGAVFDVVVDIREYSPTFGQSVSTKLTAENNRMLWIPEGFAHGFLALEETHFLYKTTDFYNKACEASIRWDDPSLAIDWPKEIEFIVNKKDKSAPLLTDCKKMTRHPTKNTALFDLDVIGDNRGSLVVIEQGSNLPFNLKRAYYIFATRSDVSRGYHAHKRLQQVAVCLAGKCRMLLDNGKIRENYILDSPTKGLLINRMMWREMHDFSEDCILVLFASEYYDESDYIRDYDQFIKEVRNG